MMTSDLDQRPQVDQRLAGQAAEIPDSPGARLRQTRQVKKLNVDYVATSLHLSRSVIEAIERDDYDRLPSAVFVAGYIRSYARLLGLDPEPLNLSFRRLHPGAEAPPRQVGRNTGRDEAHDGGNWLPGLLFLVVVLVIGGGAYLWWTGHPLVKGIFPGGTAMQPETAPSSAPAGAAEEPSDRPLQTLQPPARSEGGIQSDATRPSEFTSERSLEAPTPEARESTLSPTSEPPRSVPPAPARSSDATAAIETATEGTPPSGEISTADDRRPLPTPEPPDTTATAADSGPSEPQTAGSILEPDADTAAQGTDASPETAEPEPEPGANAGTVELSFTGPCWVDIRDATGEVLLFGEMSRDDREVLGGEPPYSLVLGNASAVEVRVGGQDYDIRSYSRGNVARFELDPAEVEPTADATEAE